MSDDTCKSPATIEARADGYARWKRDHTVSSFEGANFSGADAHNANFRLTNLEGANFEDADVSGADFSCALLHRASFRNANCTGANFRDADLTRAEFEGAVLTNAILPDGTVYHASSRLTEMKPSRLYKVRRFAMYRYFDLKRWLLLRGIIKRW